MWLRTLLIVFNDLKVVLDRMLSLIVHLSRCSVFTQIWIIITTLLCCCLFLLTIRLRSNIDLLATVMDRLFSLRNWWKILLILRGNLYSYLSCIDSGSIYFRIDSLAIILRPLVEWSMGFYWNFVRFKRRGIFFFSS